MSGAKKFEKFSAIFLIAGVGSLVVAFLVLAFAPVKMLQKVDNQIGMPTKVPLAYTHHYKNLEEYTQGLLHGRDIYIQEACWHCHSQYVRPVSNEALRYGPVATPGEYQNILHLPQLFGTRRVGPDLSRESGKRTNDWHYAHLFNPKWVEPQSVMPTYPWFFNVKLKEGEKGPIDLSKPYNLVIEPKQEAIDLVAYLQWLGNDFASVVGENYETNDIIMPPQE